MLLVDFEEFDLLLQLVDLGLNLGKLLVTLTEPFFVFSCIISSGCTLLFEIVELIRDRKLFSVIDGELQRAALFVLFLVVFELLLFFLQFSQTFVDVCKKLVNLLALVIRLGHDLQ
ncbi:MAG: hypothetical protein Q9183_006383 [Haloplaca sp. 2 TL-2023]